MSEASFDKNGLISDREFMWDIVYRNGLALRCASEDIKNDKNFVLRACLANPMALQYASDNIKNDKVFISKITNKHGSILKYTSREIQNNKKIVSEAIKKDYKSFAYASDSIKNDKEFILNQSNLAIVRFMSKELIDDKNFIYSLTMKDVRILDYLPRLWIDRKYYILLLNHLKDINTMLCGYHYYHLKKNKNYRKIFDFKLDDLKVSTFHNTLMCF